MEEITEGLPDNLDRVSGYIIDRALYEEPSGIMSLNIPASTGSPEHPRSWKKALLRSFYA